MNKTIDALAQALEAPGCERIKDFYSVGPVQRAAVEQFVEALAQARAEQAEPAAGARDGMRGAPCEVQDGDPSSPTHRQWLKARFVALDPIAGEPIVQVQGRMPWFATWASVRGITPPAAPAPKLDSAHESVAAKPKLEPCGVVESAVRGCEGYHVRVWPGQPAPRVGAELYTHPPAAPVAKLEPLTDAEKRELAGNYFAEDWAQEKAIGLMDDFEAAHNAKLTGIKSST